jgi:hypothetical protein
VLDLEFADKVIDALNRMLITPRLHAWLLTACRVMRCLRWTNRRKFTPSTAGTWSACLVC